MSKKQVKKKNNKRTYMREYMRKYRSVRRKKYNAYMKKYMRAYRSKKPRKPRGRPRKPQEQPQERVRYVDTSIVPAPDVDMLLEYDAHIEVSYQDAWGANDIITVEVNTPDTTDRGAFKLYAQLVEFIIKKESGSGNYTGWLSLLINDYDRAGHAIGTRSISVTRLEDYRNEIVQDIRVNARLTSRVKRSKKNIAKVLKQIKEAEKRQNAREKERAKLRDSYQ